MNYKLGEGNLWLILSILLRTQKVNFWFQNLYRPIYWCFHSFKLLISKLIGNNGDRGSLSVTNLRLIWISHRRPNTNLSVGFKSILTLSIRNARSKLRGISQALFLVAKQGTSKYEFVFTSLVKNSPRMFVTVRSVLRAYETTPLYREIKLRLLSIKIE